MKVSEKMTKEVMCLLATDTLSDAYTLMTDLDIRHLPVVENGLLIGLLSDRDILPYAQHDQGKLKVPDDVLVYEAMTTATVTCQDSTALGDIAAKMIELKIDALPVTDDGGRLTGIVTSTDLLKLVKEWERPTSIEPLPYEFNLQTRLDIPESVI